MTHSCWEQLAYGRRRNLVGSAADLRLSIPSSSSVRNGLHVCLIFLGRQGAFGINAKIKSSREAREFMEFFARRVVNWGAVTRQTVDSNEHNVEGMSGKHG